ncbi:ras-associating and dilute domain-containing protein isoform X2 [Choloepus didactylus]|uniref:ras-associating and dilute domain-containing protein isoform X2 n=1 Tax=Choloepus didactylus TaxID=27675 RepID=UPI00189F27E0|nr:ras-associating and dilute domain-containing protein isoform X2 [Choloepus didactylus]
MFYGAHLAMSPPSKSRLKRQGRLLSSMLSRTLSHRYRDPDAAFSGLGAGDDPAELSTQLSAPGILKVFGDSVCSGTHYKSVLATARSSAQELVREALERYGVDPARAGQYVLCDAVGQAGEAGQPWQAACFRVFADNEKPLLIQEFWKPREGLSRRFELRKKSDVEELAAKDVDTVTAGINAQARRLQWLRTKGAPAPAPWSPRLRRSASDTSLGAPGEDGERSGHGGPAHPSPAQAPHLLLLQGYSPQHCVWTSPAPSYTSPRAAAPAEERSRVPAPTFCSSVPCGTRPDSLVYVLGREQHTVGQRTPASRPSISLAAPDILPLHCTIRRRRLPGREPPEDALVLEPSPGASVAINLHAVGRRGARLHHGDLLGLGRHYLLLFKDVAPARPLPAQALAQACGALREARGTPSPRPAAPRRQQLQLEFEPEAEDALLRRILTLAEPGADAPPLAPAFLLCLCAQHAAARFPPGAFARLLLRAARLIREAVWEKTKELAEKQAQLAPVLVQPVLRGPGPGPAARPALDGQRRGAALLRPAAEPALHAAPGGGAERLRLGGVAALLHACGQRGGHGAAGGDRSLRLPAVRLLHLQGILTRSGVEALPSPCPVEPARVGPGDASEDGRAPHAAAGQNHSCPWHPEQERGAGGPLRCGHFLWALWALGQRNSAGLAGQQPRPGQGVPQTEVIGPGRTRGRAAPGDERAAPSPQALYVCLPGLLEGPPFQTEPWEGQGGEPVLPEELRRVVAVYQAALDLLRRAQLHPEVASQVLAYLLFFSGTLLFNQLLDKGPLLSCFHWPRGVQACARLQQLLEWVKSAGFGSAGEQFFQKLSCTLNLLATPSAQLVQMPWAALRTRFPALSPAQLHRLLTRYQLASAMGPVSAWEPGTQESSDALKPEAVLESYENPPPIVLPSGGFQVDPEADCVDDSLYQHVLHLRHFLQGLQSQGPAHAAPDGRHCTLASGDLLDPRSRGTQEAGPAHSPPPGVAPWAQGPPGRPPIRGSAQAGPVPTDASCLLTPPSTPLELEPGGPCGQMLPEGQRNGLGSPWGMAPKGDPSSRSSSPEESCCVFLVELERGPSGLGLGLIDGLHTPQGAPGLYVQTLLPGSPAACDGRLSLGDRILESCGPDPPGGEEDAVSSCQV